MESRLVREHLDLLVALGWLALAAAATLLSLGGPVRLVLLIPVTLFIPGYAIVSLAYPTAGAPPEESTIGQSETGLRQTFARGDTAVGGVERFALAVLWSLIAVPAVALAVHFSPAPIAAGPVQVGVFSATAALLAAAAVSRARQPAEDRFSPPAPSLPNFLGPSSGFRASFPALGHQSGSASRSWPRLLLAASLLVLASSVGYAFVAPPDDPEFTELYVRSGNVTDATTALYPATLVRDESESLGFAVVNREGATTEYSYVVELQRVERSETEESVVNGTANASNASGANVTTEVVAETEVDRGSFALAVGETRNVTTRITPRATGEDFRVVVLVYRGEVPADPALDDAYRSLRLPVSVTADGGDTADREMPVPAGATGRLALGAPRGGR